MFIGFYYLFILGTEDKKIWDFSDQALTHSARREGIKLLVYYTFLMNMV